MTTPTTSSRAHFNPAEAVDAGLDMAERVPLLEVKHLNVSYRKSGLGRRTLHQVLHDVSFTINEGEIMGLVGESGS
ncbi:MAG: hypothetical protein IJG63_00405, partial [Oscillospiraceae bacterium]|nr:hypothetical protein [Oscillospiraceae bacterium]